MENHMKKIIISTLIFALLSAVSSFAAHHGDKKDDSMKDSMDIVALADHTGQFTTLLAAVEAAGLTPVLKGDGPFTLMAPTDEAFAKLPAGTVEDLLKPENKEKLTAILTYHVVPGKAMAADVVQMSSAKTVNGKEFSIKVEGDMVYVDNAMVTKTDIPASNGVIHIIDSVLIPE